MPVRIVALKRLSVVLSALLLILSCQKELSTEPGRTGLQIINDFHEQHRNEKQSFSSNPANASVLSTAKGSKMYLPAGGFVTMDGRPVTGNVNITVKEILTPGEMILANMPTTAGTRLLESGGEFEIKVYQNNNQLKLAPGALIRINFSSAGRNMTGMQVFNGVKDADGNIDWLVNTNPGNVVVRDSLLFSDANLFADDINWLNCDKFINDPTVEFSVYPGNAPAGDSTNVFVHLTGRNTVVKMNWTRGLNYFKSDMLLAVPSTIVGIGVKNGQLFASVSTASITHGSSTTMNFQPYTEQELKQKLSQLR